MTNNEYEKECNIRTLSPYGELQIKEIDEKIARLEQSIAAEQERRREVINRYGLNKCRGGLLKIGVSYVVGEQPTEQVKINKCEHVIGVVSGCCLKCGCAPDKIDDQHSHLCD